MLAQKSYSSLPISVSLLIYQDFSICKLLRVKNLIVTTVLPVLTSFHTIFMLPFMSSHFLILTSSNRKYLELQLYCLLNELTKLTDPAL